MAGIQLRRATGADLAQRVPLCVEHLAFEHLPHGLASHADASAAAMDATPARVYARLAFHAGHAIGYAPAPVAVHAMAGPGVERGSGPLLPAARRARDTQATLRAVLDVTCTQTRCVCLPPTRM
jgi:hypothetical protein